jgi:hypothetical protein
MVSDTGGGGFGSVSFGWMRFVKVVVRLCAAPTTAHRRLTANNLATWTLAIMVIWGLAAFDLEESGAYWSSVSDWAERIERWP